MKKLSSAERQKQILELLSQNGAMKTLDLSNYFHVSRETMRRDLIALTEQGAIEKWFGGVICSSHLAQHPSVYGDIKNRMGMNAPEEEDKDYSIQVLDEKMELHSDIKMLISQKVLEFLPPRATIFVDNGSTTLHLARLLSQLSGYTIITASIPVINACINSSNKLIICGGVVDSLIMSSTGTPTVEFLNHLKTDVAIFGSSGFKSNGGPTGNDLDYSQIKKAALRNTQTSIVLADSSKATYSSMIQFAEWKEIDYLITDSALDPAFRNQFADSTQIILADA